MRLRYIKSVDLSRAVHYISKKEKLIKGKYIVTKLSDVIAFSLILSTASMLHAEEADETSFRDRPVEAIYATKPVVIDGLLDDEAWKSAPVYKMDIPLDNSNPALPQYLQKRIPDKILEGADIRLAWDQDYLYIATSMKDSDLHCYGDQDQMFYFNLGDVLEVFIKPDSETYYWELYCAPNGKKTSFFFPGRGAKFLPLSLSYRMEGLKTAAALQGSLNKWDDKDISWTAEMAVPFKELSSPGSKAGPDDRWKILFSRFNHNRYFSSPELSSFPKLSKPNFHLYEEYALIVFKDPQ